MDRTRAVEIIEAYGADPARWPAEEREAALAWAKRDAAVGRAMAEAETLDAMLVDWAREPLASDGVAEASIDAVMARLPVAGAARSWWPKLVLGGSIAAAIAIGALLIPPDAIEQQPDARQPAAQQTQTPVQTAQISADAQVWAQVFTPTPEEESLI